MNMKIAQNKNIALKSKNEMKMKIIGDVLNQFALFHNSIISSIVKSDG